jgi:hypothetical protein
MHAFALLANDDLAPGECWHKKWLADVLRGSKALLAESLSLRFTLTSETHVYSNLSVIVTSLGYSAAVQWY